MVRVFNRKETKPMWVELESDKGFVNLDKAGAVVVTANGAGAFALDLSGTDLPTSQRRLAGGPYASEAEAQAALRDLVNGVSAENT